MKLFLRASAMAFMLGFSAVSARTDPVRITVHTDQTIQPVHSCLKGICIEDVNHEIYGGLYSQMIFGESFGEPGPTPVVDGFHAYGGSWSLQGQVISANGEEGPTLVSEHAPIANGTVGVEIKFANKSGENAGLVVRVNRPGIGADNFAGYEISVDPARQIVRLARHRQDYQLLDESPCDVRIDQWIALQVKLDRENIKINVNGKTVLIHRVSDELLRSGTVGLRVWHCHADFRNLWMQAQGAMQHEPIPFVDSKSQGQVSEMWRPIVGPNAMASFALSSEHPFIGSQSQHISFTAGDGEVGITNAGLNHWGLHFEKGKEYEGFAWVKTQQAVTLVAALESKDGTKTYSEKTLPISQGDWQRVGFSLNPDEDDGSGRFALKLKQPGSISIGYVFLQPGEWGRFAGLPVRKDIAQAIIDQGVRVMRYGGSMVNSQNYRWKNMIGPRDRRPPYNGTWYPYSSNGWGVIDFLNLCEAANIAAVPDLNVNESPQDMVDFIEYVNGAADSAWGHKRALDGHPQSYHLHYLEVGNEEKVDAAYADKFAAIAQAIWAKDPDIILIVGDFSYHKTITDPDHITGADGGILNLNGQRQILKLAREHNRQVWFDIHIWSEQLQPSDGLVCAPSYMDALDKIANGAKHRVLTFELNANSHGLQRGLANAMSINTLVRDNRMPVITSANGLQPDGQNDNGWDQGLLFLNPSQVWLQPAGYVTQMQAKNDLPMQVKCDVDAADAAHLNVTAARSDDGKTLVVQIVNPSDAKSVLLDLDGFAPTRSSAHVTELAGPLDAVNTADNPANIVPKETDWRINWSAGKLHRDLSAHSFTILRFE